MHSDVAVIIPSRLGSTRLPGKALAKIGDKHMIQHVVENIKSGFNGEVFVATDAAYIAEVAETSGAIAVMTDQNCQTGSDRVYQAFSTIPNHNEIKYIINVQGDMPFINHRVIGNLINKIKQGQHDMVTPVVKVDKEIASSESNVKVVFDNNYNALYFSRSLIPHGAREFYYHIGIYGFTRDALSKFVHLPVSNYEKSENLEQLRALENGMKIGICLVDAIPISVDTQQDLLRAQSYFNSRH